MLVHTFAFMITVSHVIPVTSSTLPVVVNPPLVGGAPGVAYPGSRAGQGQVQVTPLTDLLLGNQGTLALNPVAAVVSSVPDPTRVCYTVPAHTPFNITHQSYFYPRDRINAELTVRKDVLELIFKDGVKAISPYDEKHTLYSPTEEDKQSSVGDGVQSRPAREGCAGYRLLLRSFDHYGGHCWVVHPRHQAVTFVTCGTPKCKGLSGTGDYSACAVEERTVSVWAWCETLTLGQRIRKIVLPVPVSCKCQIYNC